MSYLDCAVVLRLWDPEVLAVDIHQLELKVRDTVLVCDDGGVQKKRGERERANVVNKQRRRRHCGMYNSRAAVWKGTFTQKKPEAMSHHAYSTGKWYLARKNKGAPPLSEQPADRAQQGQRRQNASNINVALKESKAFEYNNFEF